MGKFKVDNGKKGVERVCHTTTGYECVANHSGNIGGSDRIMFFARCVVGFDGSPYTEIGLRGVEDTEKNTSFHDFREKLSKSGFTEVMNASNVGSVGRSFLEHTRVPSDVVAFRVNCGGDGILSVIAALSDYVNDSSYDFIEEQESVEDSLFQSILYNMGDELKKGPKGKGFAVIKAKQLAHEFKYGLNMEGNESLKRVN